MTNQEVWNFLKAGKGKKRKLEELDLQLKQLEEGENYIKAIDYEKPTVSGGTTSDLSSIVAQQEEAAKRLKKSIIETTKEILWWKNEVLAMTRFCNNDVQAGILIAKFVNEKSWKEIQKEYRYSESQPYVICRQAVAEIANKYKPANKEHRKQ